MKTSSAICYYNDGVGIYNSRRGELLSKTCKVVRFYQLEHISESSLSRLSRLSYQDNTTTHVLHQLGEEPFRAITQWHRGEK